MVIKKSFVLRLLMFCSLSNQKAAGGRLQEAYELGKSTIPLYIDSGILKDFLCAAFAYKYLELSEIYETPGVAAMKTAMYAIACNGISQKAFNAENLSYLYSDEQIRLGKEIRNKFIESMEYESTGGLDKTYIESVSIAKTLFWISLFENLFAAIFEKKAFSECTFDICLKLANCAFYSYVRYRKQGLSHSNAVTTISREIFGQYGKLIFQKMPSDPYKIGFDS